jgi:hypothetical protein
MEPGWYRFACEPDDLVLDPPASWSSAPPVCR